MNDPEDPRRESEETEREESRSEKVKVELPQVIPEEGEREERPQEIVIRLYRNNDLHSQSYKFSPKDEIRLDILGTGTSRATVVTMKDCQGQVRFRGRSGGMDHVFKTRIQYTKTFGMWRFEVTYPDHFEHTQELVVEFEVMDMIPEVEMTVQELERVEREEEQEYQKEEAEETSTAGEMLEYPIPISELSLATTTQISKLVHNNITSFTEFLDSDTDELSDLLRIEPEIVESWKHYVKDVLLDQNNPLHRTYLEFGELKRRHRERLSGSLESKEADDPVLKIKFVGKKSEEKLKRVGILTVRDLITADDQKLRSADVPYHLVRRWLREAYHYLNLETFDEMSELERIKKKYYDY